MNTRSGDRNLGIDIIEALPWGAHFCQFYNTKEDLVDILIPYFKAGLENNEFCLWIPSYPLKFEGATETIRAAIPDLEIYLDKGQIEIISYVDWHKKSAVFNSEEMLNYLAEKINQANASGYDGLRFAWNLSFEKGFWDDCIDYEKRLNSLVSKSPMLALCAYPLKICGSVDIIEISADHQFSLIKKNEKWQRLKILSGKMLMSAGRKLDQCGKVRIGTKQSSRTV